MITNVDNIKLGAQQTTNTNCTHNALLTAYQYLAMLSAVVWLGCC